MNKKKAKEQACSNTKTWEELFAVLDGANLSGMSKVNKSLTREQVYSIFQSMKDDISDLTIIPKGMRYSFRRDKEIISGEALSIMNLLREFG